jgi:hypothetical protein
MERSAGIHIRKLMPVKARKPSMKRGSEEAALILMLPARFSLRLT